MGKSSRTVALCVLAAWHNNGAGRWGLNNDSEHVRCRYLAEHGMGVVVVATIGNGSIPTSAAMSNLMSAIAAVPVNEE